jgi:hypothetical protein
MAASPRAHFGYGSMRQQPLFRHRRPRVVAETLERRVLCDGGPLVQSTADSDDQIAEAIPTGNGITGGTLSDAQDVDLYAVKLDGARRVTFDIDSTTPWDSYLRLFDPAGNELTSNDDAEGPAPETNPGDSYISYVFTFPGTYYVGVSSDGNRAYDPASGADAGGDSAGGYRLVIQGLPNPLDTDDRLASARPVVDGTFASRIDVPDDADLYRVSVRAGDVVTVDLDAEPLSGELDTYLRAFTATGTQLAANDDAVGPEPEFNSHESFLRLELTAAGDYYFGVSSPGNDDYNVITGTDGDLRVGGSVGAYTLTVSGVTPPPESPKVTQLYLNGLNWTPQFRQHLADRGFGSAQLGYAVPVTDQLNELPWSNLNQLSIVFSDHVTVKREDLVVRGVNVASYPVVDMAYDTVSHTATWLIGRTIGNDRLLLDLDADAGGVNAAGVALDGEWASGADTFPSGDGTPGGDFRFQVNVLPGDTTRSGSVVADDFSEVKKRFFRSTTSPGPAGDTQYTIFHDVDGSSSIVAADFSEVKRRFFNTLPPNPPPAIAASFGDRRITPPAARELLA